MKFPQISKTLKIKFYFHIFIRDYSISIYFIYLKSYKIIFQNCLSFFMIFSIFFYTTMSMEQNEQIYHFSKIKLFLFVCKIDYFDIYAIISLMV